MTPVQQYALTKLLAVVTRVVKCRKLTTALRNDLWLAVWRWQVVAK